MALADLQQKPSGILCPVWTAKAPGSKRCAQYLDCGACGLPTELMCVEWMIRNHSIPKLEADLRANRYETPDQFVARFNREHAPPAPPPVALPVTPPAPPPMTPPKNKLAEALASLQSVAVQPTNKPKPAPAKSPGGLSDALARLNALK